MIETTYRISLSPWSRNVLNQCDSLPCLTCMYSYGEILSTLTLALSQQMPLYSCPTMYILQLCLLLGTIHILLNTVEIYHFVWFLQGWHIVMTYTMKITNCLWQNTATQYVQWIHVSTKWMQNLSSLDCLETVELPSHHKYLLPFVNQSILFYFHSRYFNQITRFLFVFKCFCNSM